LRGWQANKKRTCALPVSFGAMPENEMHLSADVPRPFLRADFQLKMQLWD
jgi:hypothetical protein